MREAHHGKRRPAYDQSQRVAVSVQRRWVPRPIVFEALPPLSQGILAASDLRPDRSETFHCPWRWAHARAAHCIKACLISFGHIEIKQEGITAGRTSYRPTLHGVRPIGSGQQPYALACRMCRETMQLDDHVARGQCHR